MDTLKIYFIEYDENGNEIRRGVHPGKEYKTYGRAWRTADKYYSDHDRFEVYIDTREPWGEYTRECTCCICKQTFVCKEDSRHMTCETRIELGDFRHYSEFRTRKQIRESGYFRRKTWDTLIACPECYEKVKGFIESITLED